MKLLNSMSVLLLSTVCAVAQLVKFSGELKDINNTSVSGYFSGYFDYKTSTATVIGTASASASDVKLTPINDLKVPMLPTSGVIYNLQTPTFATVDVTKTFESVSKTNFDIFGLKLYVLTKNEYVSLDSTFKAVPAKKYTIVLNSADLPVSYGTFYIPVPEPEQISLIGGLSLVGVVLIRRIKGY